MSENRMMSLAALVNARDQNKVDPKLMVALSQDAIARKDGDIKAFTHLAAEPGISTQGPLAGIAIGVKDIFDTFDQPTTYGSPAYNDHHPRVDAAIHGLGGCGLAAPQLSHLRGVASAHPEPGGLLAVALLPCACVCACVCVCVRVCASCVSWFPRGPVAANR